MNGTKSIETIYKVAKSKMSESEACQYVGTVVTFCINKLSEHGKFTSENLEVELEEEAAFHLICQSKDVA